MKPMAILRKEASMSAPSAKEYFSAGMLAYQQGNFPQAIEDFLHGLQWEQQNWDTRLYLGMAYARLGKLREAKQEFLSVRDMSLDPELRRKAAAALTALTPSASQQSIKKLSSQ
jgi:Flp pilus assembly protein TadD